MLPRKEFTTPTAEFSASSAPQGLCSLRTSGSMRFRPRRRKRAIPGDMPIGILGSLFICTILYVLFSYVLSGVATVQDFRTAGREASVAFAITKYMTGFEWLSKSVTVAILRVFRRLFW